MNGPSKNWLSVRRAVLDRAERKVFDPLSPLFTIYAVVCAYYIIGALRFQFFDQTATFTWIEAIQILTVAAAGLLVPVLTGSVMMLHFTSRRLQMLTNE